MSSADPFLVRLIYRFPRVRDWLLRRLVRCVRPLLRGDLAPDMKVEGFLVAWQWCRDPLAPDLIYSSDDDDEINALVQRRSVGCNPKRRSKLPQNL